MNNFTNNPAALAVTDWLKQHSAIGAKCGNCEKPFTATRKAKTIVCIPNTTPAGQLNSHYVLCRPCARAVKREGLPGIPHAATDAKRAALLHSAPVVGQV